jgi:pyruvyltransferase
MNSQKTKERIFLGWANSKNEPNFGDELGPYIFAKITGMDIVHIPVLNSRFHLLMLLVKRLITLRLKECWNFTQLLFGKNFYISVGSIIQFYKLNGGIVWGAGLIDDKYTTGRHKYYAVRGPKTRALLEKKGYSVPEVYGDPALILPKIYSKRVEIRNKIGIVPHIIHYEDLKEYKIHSQMKVIDLKTKDIEVVVDEIRGCELIVSSSLHGLIVAHAYGIPALWVRLGNVKLMGNNVKFYDYFESIQLPEYDEISIDLNKLSNLDCLHLLFRDFARHTNPKPQVLTCLIQNMVINAPPMIKNQLLKIIHV